MPSKDTVLTGENNSAYHPSNNGPGSPRLQLELPTLSSPSYKDSLNSFNSGSNGSFNPGKLPMPTHLATPNNTVPSVSPMVTPITGTASNISQQRYGEVIHPWDGRRTASSFWVKIITTFCIFIALLVLYRGPKFPSLICWHVIFALQSMVFAVLGILANQQRKGQQLTVKKDDDTREIWLRKNKGIEQDVSISSPETPSGLFDDRLTSPYAPDQYQNEKHVEHITHAEPYKFTSSSSNSNGGDDDDDDFNNSFSSFGLKGTRAAARAKEEEWRDEYEDDVSDADLPGSGSRSAASGTDVADVESGNSGTEEQVVQQQVVPRGRLWAKWHNLCMMFALLGMCLSILCIWWHKIQNDEHHWTSWHGWMGRNVIVSWYFLGILSLLTLWNYPRKAPAVVKQAVEKIGTTIKDIVRNHRRMGKINFFLLMVMFSSGWANLHSNPVGYATSITVFVGVFGMIGSEWKWTRYGW